MSKVLQEVLGYGESEEILTKFFISSSVLVCIAAVIDLIQTFMFTSFAYIELIKIIVYGFLLIGNYLFLTKLGSKENPVTDNNILLMRITYFCLCVIVLFDMTRYGFGLCRFFLEILNIILFMFVCSFQEDKKNKYYNS